MKIRISLINANHRDTGIPATMVNGYDDSNYGLGTNTASQARELKRQRIDSPVDGLQAQPGRCCFVTVGATAGFRSLLNEITTAGFLDCLAKHGYTSLNIQCGPDLTTVESRIASLSDDEKRGISVRCFHYTDEMTTHIVNCRGQDGVRLAGCVIAHGGTGTVGEVLGIGAPLVVVANPTLMDNHQLELAETLEAQNLVVHGRIGSLPTAIHRIAERTKQDELAAQMRVADLGRAEAEFAATQQQQQQQQGQSVGVGDNNNSGSAAAAPTSSSRVDSSMLQLD